MPQHLQRRAVSTACSLSRKYELYYLNYYRKYKPYCLNYYKLLDVIEPVYEDHAVDTALLCKYWGIDKDSFPTYINKIYNYIREITKGYHINEINFPRDGLYFFASEYNGWGIIYQKDSVLNNEKQQEHKLSLPKKGYSQVENTRFWVNDNDE